MIQAKIQVSHSHLSSPSALGTAPPHTRSRKVSQLTLAGSPSTSAAATPWLPKRS